MHDAFHFTNTKKLIVASSLVLRGARRGGLGCAGEAHLSSPLLSKHPGFAGLTTGKRVRRSAVHGLDIIFQVFVFNRSVSLKSGIKNCT